MTTTNQINILSLFDGMSCGQIALKKNGFHFDKYFASEVDKFAIQVTQANFPETIQIGDVRNIQSKNLPEIFLLQGGSPCQSFSFAGKRKGMSTKDNIEILSLDQYLELKNQGFEFQGQSYLFWEFVRLLNEVKPKYFFLENVLMSKKWKQVITNVLGVQPIEINSAILSAQNRKRLYWTNIGMIDSDLFGSLNSGIKIPPDKNILLKDILQKEVDEKYFLSEKLVNSFVENSNKMKLKGNGFSFNPSEGNEKSKSLTTKNGSRMTDNFILIKEATKKGFIQVEPGDCFDNENPNSKTRRGRLMKEKTNCLMSSQMNFLKYDKNECSILIRKLTPIECERLQTVPDNYTNHVSDSQRYKMLGNGWTVDVIAYIYSYMQR